MSKPTDLLKKLTKKQQIDMVAKGYSPLQESDVKAYLNKKKPKEGAQLQKEVAKGSFGEGHIDDNKDYKQIEGEYDEGGGSDVDLSEPVKDFEPSDIKNEMSGEGGKDAPIIGDDDYEEEEDDFGPISNNRSKRRSKKRKSKRGKLTNEDAKKAKNIGYKYNIQVLKAMASYLKKPSEETREGLMESLENLSDKEEQLPDKLLKYWKKGIKESEKKNVGKIING